MRARFLLRFLFTTTAALAAAVSASGHHYGKRASMRSYTSAKPAERAARITDKWVRAKALGITGLLGNDLSLGVASSVEGVGSVNPY